MPGWETFDTFLTEAQATPQAERQALVDTLIAEHPSIPWVNSNKATFLYARRGAERVAINLDKIKKNPPLAPMKQLEGTSLFYLTLEFQTDDLLDYLVAVNDPMTPLRPGDDIASRVKKFWRTDPYNPAGIQTAAMDVSVLKMPAARPFPDWSRMKQVNRGNTIEHRINSNELGVKDRKVWIHTPANYDESTLTYPLLVLQDGQWMVSPLQVPHIVDALIKHGRMAPIIVAMVQSAGQATRLREYVIQERYDEFVIHELLPFLQSHYRIDASNLGIGGAAAGAIASADTAIQNTDRFQSLIMLSPPLGKGPGQEKLQKYQERFQTADLLPERIFHSVGRYEEPTRFLNPSLQLASILSERSDVQYKFVELGSGHGLVAFRSILPEALSWAFPGWASLQT